MGNRNMISNYKNVMLKYSWLVRQELLIVWEYIILGNHRWNDDNACFSYRSRFHLHSSLHSRRTSHSDWPSQDNAHFYTGSRRHMTPYLQNSTITKETVLFSDNYCFSFSLEKFPLLFSNISVWVSNNWTLWVVSNGSVFFSYFRCLRVN